MSDKAPSIKDTFKSVMSAFAGIQSDKNRKKDFSQGKISHFIIVGVISVVLFIAVLIVIVNLVIPTT